MVGNSAGIPAEFAYKETKSHLKHPACVHLSINKELLAVQSLLQLVINSTHVWFSSLLVKNKQNSHKTTK